jgi:GNAT superfamily N-acetyltransferase
MSSTDLGGLPQQQAIPPAVEVPPTSTSPGVMPSVPVAQEPKQAPIIGPQPAQPSLTDWAREQAQKIKQEREQVLYRNLYEAAKTDPVMAAEVQRIAKEMQVDPSAVENNLDVLRAAQRARELRSLDIERNAPVVASALRDPKIAAIAHDQVQGLGTLERLRLKLNNGMLINEQGAIGERMRRRVDTQADRDRLAEIERIQERMPKSPGSYFEPAAEVLGQMLDVVPQALATGVATGAAAAPIGLAVGGPPGAGAAFLEGLKTGTMAGWAASTYTVESGNQYLDLRRAGYSHEIASKASPGMGLFNAAIDLVGLYTVSKPFVAIGQKMLAKGAGAVVGGVTKAAVRPTLGAALRKAATYYAEAVTSETGVETIQEVSAILSDRYARNLQALKGLPEVSPAPTTGENLSRLEEIAKTTAMAMSVLAFPGPAMHFVASKREVDRANQAVEAWKQIGELGKQDELRKRDPAAWAKIVRESAAKVGATEVYIEQARLVEVLMAKQQAEAEKIAAAQGVPVEQVLSSMPDVFTQLADIDAKTAADAKAVKSGSDDVVIPVETFEAKFAGTDLGASLLDHVRMSEDARSLFDARERLKKIQTDFAGLAEKANEKLEQDDEFAKSHQTVFQIYAEQLAKTGRFNDEQVQMQAEFMAAIYAARAARDGTTPEQEFLRFPYTIEAGQDRVDIASKVLRQARDITRMSREAVASMVAEDADTSVGGFEILADEPGKRGGFLLFRDDPKAVSVTSVQIDPSMQRLGYGRRMHILAAQRAAERNVDLKSGAVEGDAMRGYWQRLADRGLAKPADIVDGVAQSYVVPKKSLAAFIRDQESHLQLRPAPVTVETASANPRLTPAFLAARQDNHQTSLEDRGVFDSKSVELDRIVDLEGVPKLKLTDLVGMKIFPTLADRTAAGRTYKGIDDSTTIEIPLLGGPLFMLRESNWAANVVWANRGESVTSSKQKKVEEFGSDVMMVALGSSDMHESNSTVSMVYLATIIAYIRDGKITEANKRALESTIRALATKKAPALRNFSLDIELEQMRAYVDALSFEGRSIMFKAFGLKGARELGVPDPKLILDATREPSMAGHRWGQGVALVRIDRENPFIELGTGGTTAHPDFPLGIRGTVIGVMETPVGWDVLWRDWAKAKFEAKVQQFEFIQTKEWRKSKTWKSRRAAVQRAAKLGVIRADTAKLLEDAIDQSISGKDKKTPSQYDAKIGTDREDYIANMSLERSFQLEMPVVEVTQDLVDRIGDISQGNVFNQKTASIGVDMALGRWRDNTVIQEKNGIAPIEFIDAIARTGQTVSPEMEREIRNKRGNLRIYQLGKHGIWFAYDTVKGIVSHAVNEEQGARGIATPAILLKAIELGAKGLRMFEGTSDAEMQFWASAFEPFGFKRNPTDPLLFDYHGTDTDRIGATARYLATGLPSLLDERTAANVAAAENAFVDDARASGSAIDEAGLAKATAGARSGVGASLASRAHAVVRDIAQLSDSAARNIGITVEERDAVRAGLDDGTLARDGSVFRQLEDKEPDPRDLVVVHNVSQRTAKDLVAKGANAVLVAPSLAIVNTRVDTLHDFGDISFIGSPEQVDPETGAALVRDADQWTARYPKDIQADLPRATIEAMQEYVLNSIHGLRASMVDAARADRSWKRHDAKRSSLVDSLDFLGTIYPSGDFIARGFYQYYKALHKIYALLTELYDRDENASSEMLKDMAQWPAVIAALSGKWERMFGRHALDEFERRYPDVKDPETFIRALDEFAGEIITDRDRAKVAEMVTVTPMFKPEEGPDVGKLIPATVGNVLRAMQAAAWKEGEDARLGEIGKRRKEMMVISGFGPIRAAVSRRLASIAEISRNRDKIVAQNAHLDYDFVADLEKFVQDIYRAALDLSRREDGTWPQTVAQGNPLHGPMTAYQGEVVSPRLAIAVGDLVSIVDREITEDDVREVILRQGLLEIDGAKLREFVAQTLPLWQGITKRAQSLTADYFEAKATRAVPLHEFRGAVLPRSLENTDLAKEIARTREVRFYEDDNKADRLQAVREVSTALEQNSGKQDVFFQLKDEQPDRNLVATHSIETKALTKMVLFSKDKDAAVLANPSIAVVNLDVGTLTEFGDATLVAPSSLVDPTKGGVHVRDADQWTARFPADRIVYKVRPEAAKDSALMDRIDRALSIINAPKAGPILEKVIGPALQEAFVGDATSAFNASYELQEVSWMLRGIKEHLQSVAEYEASGKAAIAPAHNVDLRPLVAAVILGNEEVVSSLSSVEGIIALMKRAYAQHGQLAFRGTTESRHHYMQQTIGLTTDQVYEAIGKLYEKALTIRNESPRDRTLPFTIGNISKVMNEENWSNIEGAVDTRLGELKGHKGFTNYGAARAAISRPFSSLAEMSKSRGRIVSTMAHEGGIETLFGHVLDTQVRVREHVEHIYARHFKANSNSSSKTARALIDALRTANVLGSVEEDSQVVSKFAISVGDLVSLGKGADAITSDDVLEAFRRNKLLDQTGVFAEDIEAANTLENIIAMSIVDMMRELVRIAENTPADYFEAKRTQPTSIYEFGGVVLPEAYRDHQIAAKLAETHIVEFYKPGSGKSHADAVRRVAHRMESERGADALFQRAKASFDPKRLVAMLYSKADVSSFIHETGHFYLEMLMQRAASSAATATDIEDANELLRWFATFGGVIKDGWTVHDWAKMTVDQQRPYHEALAYGFEIHISEGKSPSLALQNVFRRLAAWMREVYKGLIKSVLNEKYKAEFGRDLPGLSDGVRRALDRMLASQEEIDQARLARGEAATFVSRENFLGTDAEYAALQQEFADEKEEAIQKLSQAKERNARWAVATQERLTREQRAIAMQVRMALKQEVEDELREKPVYQAAKFIRDGEVSEEGITGPHRLDVAYLDERTILRADGTAYTTEQIREKLGVGRGKLLGVTQSLSPDAVAERFGFDDGVKLIESLMNEPTFEQAVEARVQERFEAEYGELADEKAVQAAIVDAMANELHIRAIAAELRVLTSMTEPTRLLIEGAKLAAQAEIDATPLRELTWAKIQRAADNAARASLKAQAKGDLNEAIVQKRKHLMLMQKLRLVIDMQRDLEKRGREIRRVFTDGNEKLAKSRDLAPIMAMQLILSYHKQAPGSWDAEKIAVVRDTFARLDPEMYEQLRELIDDAQADGRAFSEMPSGQVVAKFDILDGLWKLSRSARQIEVEQEALDMDAAADQLIAQANATRTAKPQAGRTKAVTASEERGAQLLAVKAGMRRVETWAMSMDGDGTPGAFTKLVWRPVKNALTAFRVRRREILDRLGRAFEAHDFGSPSAKIEAREVGYTFANRAELIAALVHMGNEGNYRRLILGQERPFGKLLADGKLDDSQWRAFIDRAEATGIIRESDWAVVRAIWDAHEEIRGDIEAAHYKLRGFPMKVIKPWKVKTRWGEIDGGYVPAKTDRRMVLDAQAFDKIDQLEANPLNTVATTGSGMTKQRSANYAHALSFDLGLVRFNLEQALRYAMVEPVIVGTSKLLRRRDVRATLGAIDSQVVDRMLIPWLVRSAQQTVSERGKSPLVDAFWNFARKRASLLLLGGNVVNALQQLTGVIVAASKVSPIYLAKAAMQVVLNPRDTAEKIKAASAWMAETQGKQMLELSERVRDVTLERGKWARLQDWIEDHKYFAQSFMQDAVNNVVWTAAYNEQMASGIDHAESVQRADAAVRVTQGEMTAESVAHFETGTPFVRSMMQMQSYWAMLANLNLSVWENTVGRAGFRGAPKMLTAWALTILAPSAVAVAMTAAMRGQPDNDDDDEVIDDLLFSMFVGSPAQASVAMVPGGTVLNAAIGAFTPNRFDDRILATPAVTMLESSFRGVRRIATGDVDSRGAARDLTTLGTVISGVPVSLINRVVAAADRASQLLGVK